MTLGKYIFFFLSVYYIINIAFSQVLNGLNGHIC